MNFVYVCSVYIYMWWSWEECFAFDNHRNELSPFILYLSLLLYVCILQNLVSVQFSAWHFLLDTYISEAILFWKLNVIVMNLLLPEMNTHTQILQFAYIHRCGIIWDEFYENPIIPPMNATVLYSLSNKYEMSLRFSPLFNFFGWDGEWVKMKRNIQHTISLLENY